MNRLFPIITACLLTCITAGPAWGALKQFIPKYVEFLGAVAVESLYEEDKVSSGNNTNKRSDLTIREAISFNGLGYIYSPLFVSMNTSISLGLEQERIRHNSGKANSHTDANQIKQQFKFLPAHPYNLELYGLRKRPMQSGNWGGNSPVLYEYGARAIYDLRPWNITATYSEHESRADTTTSENDSFIAHSSYYNNLIGVNVGALYHHGTFDQLDNTGNREMYGFDYTKMYESWRYTTKFIRDRQSQKNPSSTDIEASNFERQEWQNELHMDLPQNFSSLLTYTVTERNTLQQVVGEKERKTYTDTERYAFKLRHRLYKSLSSGFEYGHNYNESSGGRTKLDSYRLHADYSKKLRWGSILNSSWGTLSYLDNLGAPKKLFENHSISNLPTAEEPLPYSFTLNFQKIDRSTITIYILDNINDGINNRILLTEGLHYLLEERPGDLFRVIINPAQINSGLGLSTPIGNAEDYNYQADYAFIPSDYELRTTSWGNTIQLPLFDSLITPLYSYSETKQKEEAGKYPGIPDDSQSHTIGLNFQKIPFRAEVSQNWFRSTTNSTDRFNARFNYSEEFLSYATGVITLGYENSEITEKEQVGSDIELDETLYTVQCQLQTIWPQQNMTGTITGNYSIYKGTGDSNSLSLLTGLIWRMGQLTLDLSASYTDSDAEFGSNRTDQSYTMVRFLLKRELF